MLHMQLITFLQQGQDTQLYSPMALSATTEGVCWLGCSRHCTDSCMTLALLQPPAGQYAYSCRCSVYATKVNHLLYSSDPFAPCISSPHPPTPLCLQVLALFANGRIEQWLNCISLSPTDMCDPHMVPCIARQLRRFHSIDVALPKAPHTPWGVIQDWLQQAKQLKFTDPVKQVCCGGRQVALLPLDGFSNPAGTAWINPRNMCVSHDDHALRSASNHTIFSQGCLHTLLFCCVLLLQAAYSAIDFAALESEVNETEAVCQLTQCPLVFGHNDLLSGNILILQQPGFDPAAPDRNGRVVFIDYEYGAYTYRDFDIGNHFTEYAGFDGNYDRCVSAVSCG